MQDTTISATSAVAYIFWAVSALLLTLDMFVGPPLGSIGVFMCTVACTVHVRSFICAMGHREREAFNLGRDSVRNIR